MLKFNLGLRRSYLRADAGCKASLQRHRIQWSMRLVDFDLLMEIAPNDLAALKRAVQSLEHPGLAARLTNMVGKPIELMGQMLPDFASEAISAATSKGLEVALNVALRTMNQSPHAGSQLLHKALATASGAAGGA